MAEQPASEKTEQPTAKRLSKAKSKGQLPQSQEWVSFLSIAVLITMLTVQSSRWIQWLTGQLRQGLRGDATVFADPQIFAMFFNAKMEEVLALLMPLLGALCVGSILSGITLNGMQYNPGAIRLDLEAISPGGGLSKLFNMRSLVKLVMSILKLTVIAAIGWFYLQAKLPVLDELRWTWSLGLLAGMGKLVLGLVIRLCIALLLIGIGDAVFQKWKYMQDLKMTKQEVKEERRQSEGSPEVRIRIRKLQMQTAMKRMMKEVPKATVVLTNPTHVAVALRYDPNRSNAPVVVAKGADHMAEKIREVARAYGVPIIRRPELARTLYATVKVDRPIPEKLYVAVAEVLALIYRLRHRK